jgi:carboxyl-terminal processing protease
VLFCRSAVLAWRRIFPLLIYTVPALAQLTPEQQKANLESFEIVWQTVRDHHPDPKLNGLDWRGIFYKTKPMIAKARSMNEMRDVLRGMLALLDTSHYSIIPAGAYSPGDSGAPPHNASPNFETAVIDGKAAVTTVEPASGERAGVRPDGQGKQQRVEVPRSAPNGDLVTFANLPPMRVTLDSRRLESGAGYIRLNAFLDPARIMPRFEAALKSFAAAPGVILDLRGNPGGIGVMAMGIAGFFIDQDGLKLGEMKTRDFTVKFAVFPRPHPYRGKLALIVDERSASTSEILAQGLRDLGRARIFGTRTAGAALPSDIIRLPNGDGFQYPQASYVSANGRVLEGNGVAPDVEIRRTVADVKAGSDPAVDAAARWIAAK